MAALSFGGFGPGAIAWFAGLARDNSKAYFDRTRPQFEAEVRAPLDAFFGRLAGEFGGEVKVFRQNRDIRFSPNKAPYKLNRYGVIGGRPGSPTGLYASLSAQGLYAGTGYYQMAADQLERYRAAVADDVTGPELERILARTEASGLEVMGAALKTVPRGYPRDHPRARLLAQKDLIAGRLLEPGPALHDHRAAEFASETWRLAEPLVAFLDRHVGVSTQPPEERFRRRR